ncbi:MAG: hypothetical protein UX87_C0007G0004 [Candidatus Amesbacteria bacterium GW2011_GWA1_47_16]|uniref:Uncharacterized protein n=2 Tax=Candidatus Amesiibacteriota TaxID=1752730 RepID=A0A1F4Z2Z0_9BACT|nr:MAG: hypothetical protein UX87_C0007G0004 [Candidatus Amesbacteria bacterium GW2011_GWA1_47_16]OGD00396.1 MAG: hypothetical protein A2972_03970 [Candidatus Amesbacteria bacterium RIFCSPLOWO2_01_FULL_47_33]
MTRTLVTASQITDEIVKQLVTQNESSTSEEDVLEGEVVDDPGAFSAGKAGTSAAAPVPENEERDLRARIQDGEWDNLDDMPAFQKRTPEGRLMSRTEAIDCRIRQLEARMPMLLNQHLHDAYIQVLKKIRALRKTKGALFYMFYKHSGQRDLPGKDD